MQTYTELPPGLPVPLDDGACDHLLQPPLPALALPATDGTTVQLAQVPGWLVLYCYPRTGQPGVALPGGWDLIPGARGCTPQSCAFRDHYTELQQYGAQVYGLSVQSAAYQQEVATRLHLPFALLSDAEYRFTDALRLPTFETAGMRLNKRVTLIARDGVIQHYFYPVFPPDKNVDQVLAWFKCNAE